MQDVLAVALVISEDCRTWTRAGLVLAPPPDRRELPLRLLPPYTCVYLSQKAGLAQTRPAVRQHAAYVCENGLWHLFSPLRLV